MARVSIRIESQERAGEPLDSADELEVLRVADAISRALGVEYAAADGVGRPGARLRGVTLRIGVGDA